MNLPELVKDYIAPIVGALAGGGLNFHFDKSGSTSRRAGVNVENNTNIVGNGNSVSNVNFVDNSRKVMNYNSASGQQGGGGEGVAILFCGFAAIVASVYFYSIYAPTILFYAMLSMQAVATFSAAYGFTGGLRGTKSWTEHGLHIGLSMLLLAFAYQHCLPKLYAGYNPTYADYAHQYGAFDYFKIITPAAKNWIISQIAGVVLLIGAIAFTALYVVSRSLPQRLISLLLTAALLFGSTFGADGKIHAGL